MVNAASEHGLRVQRHRGRRRFSRSTLLHRCHLHVLAVLLAAVAAAAALLGTRRCCCVVIIIRRGASDEVAAPALREAANRARVNSSLAVCHTLRASATLCERAEYRCGHEVVDQRAAEALHFISCGSGATVAPRVLFFSEPLHSPLMSTGDSMCCVGCLPANKLKRSGSPASSPYDDTT